MLTDVISPVSFTLNQLGDEKNALIKITNSMLTKKRMKDLLDGKIKLAG